MTQNKIKDRQFYVGEVFGSDVGDIKAVEGHKRTIENDMGVIPKNLMLDMKTTVFEPEMKPIIPFGIRALSVEDAKRSDDDMNRFIDAVLISGVDFGIIPQCNKPTLFKSGAEKIMNYLGMIARTVVVNRVEDYDTGFFSYETKVYLIDYNGAVRGEGVGIVNTREGKYATQNGFSLQNVALKMSKKRALIDAVLNVGALSSRFTQDVEDMSIANSCKDVVEISSANSTHIQATTEKPATAKQIRFLESLISKHGTTVEAVNQFINQKYGIADYHLLSAIQISQIIEKFMSVKN